MWASRRPSEGLVGLTYYAFWMVLLAAAVVLAIRAVDDESPLNAAERGTAPRPACHRNPRELFLLLGSLSQRLVRCRDSRYCARRVDRGSASWRASPVCATVDHGCSRALLLAMCASAASYGEVGRRPIKAPDPLVWEAPSVFSAVDASSAVCRRRTGRDSSEKHGFHAGSQVCRRMHDPG